MTKYSLNLCLENGVHYKEHIDELIDSLKKNGMNKLGENGDVTPDMCRRVLQRSLR
ncbi:hypothetical protein MELB17_17554 [Marinobacter sp. ELB17]|nr:hypothetical protein MELB17_17554 [Marinobacter sp. ELB17]